jgi:hypothetical protein
MPSVCVLRATSCHQPHCLCLWLCPWLALLSLALAWPPMLVKDGDGFLSNKVTIGFDKRLMPWLVPAHNYWSCLTRQIRFRCCCEQRIHFSACCCCGETISTRQTFAGSRPLISSTCPCRSDRDLSCLSFESHVGTALSESVSAFVQALTGFKYGSKTIKFSSDGMKKPLQSSGTLSSIRSD